MIYHCQDLQSRPLSKRESQPQTHINSPIYVFRPLFRFHLHLKSSSRSLPITSILSRVDLCPYLPVFKPSCTFFLKSQFSAGRFLLLCIIYLKSPNHLLSNHTPQICNTQRSSWRFTSLPAPREPLSLYRAAEIRTPWLMLVQRAGA